MPEPPAARRWLLWRRWTIATTLGEFAAFSVPGVAGALAWGLGIPAAGLFGVMAVAGTAEGAILGSAQWLALRRELAGLRWRDWAGATALGAGAAWTLAMVPAAFWDQLEDVHPAMPVALLAPAGAGVLLSVGAAQWLVLRRFVERAGWWMPANAAAWAIGVTLVIAAMNPTTEDTPAAVVAAVSATSGLGMGAVVAAITGAALVWLLREGEAVVAAGATPARVPGRAR
jgi:hypothetical protein